ncbi:MAG: DEAD/DEAH box helicase [Candidatus Vogelbacteria bacterium]|nr:DEAD/DEAH box helicase [Candidatus Vogelbacteria bacterium]
MENKRNFSRPARSGYSSNSSFRSSRPPSTGGGFRGRPSSRSGGSSRGRGKGQGQYLDLRVFVNKAVIVEEVEHFLPEHNFTDFLIEDKLKQSITTKGYIAPTPIQDRIIPHILKGQDVVGIANTGTGKTGAFLIPLINKVLKNKEEKVLVVVPTRELAIQINQELKGLTPMMSIFSVVCVGGMNIQPQIRDLRHHNQFIIGTPGRIKDLIDRRALDLSNVKTVVLDEADRMLDMGFIGDMRFLMTKMSADRHTLFFSATMSKEIERLVHEFLREPVSISVKTQDTSKNVDQDIVKMKAGQDKVEALRDLLIQTGFNKVLIFGRTKHGVEKLTSSLSRFGFKVESIHGNKNHVQRQRALNAFKDDKVQILVATDVAARGLDIVGVSHVINYELPATYEDYIHRIGRTGRGNMKGQALTFVD